MPPPSPRSSDYTFISPNEIRYVGSDYRPTEAQLESIAVRATRYVKRRPGSTANEVSIALREQLSSVSSSLVKLVNAGVLERKAGVGPNGGFGYFPLQPKLTPTQRLRNALLRRTAWDHIDDDD